MPIQEVGSLVGSDRVGFNTRTRTIPAITNATLDINGTRPIMLYSLRAAANGVRNTRGLRLRISGGGLGSAIETGIASVASTTATGATFVPTVQNLTSLPNTRVNSPSGSFTITILAYTSTAGTPTNNLLESGTTGTTDDLRIGHTSSTNYWVGYGYYMVPTAPGTPSVAFSGTTASLSWSAPGDTGDAAITGYTIEYSQSSTFSSGVFTTTTTNTSINIGVGSSGTWYFRVYATNQVGSSQRSGIGSATSANPPSWNTTSLNDSLFIGSFYSTSLSVNDATSYSLASGSLPNGVSLNTSNGVISGTATAGTSQTFSFTVTATGSGGSTTSNTFFLTRYQPIPSWTDSTLSTDLRVGVFYSDSVQASNASSYSATGLPSGGLSHSGGVVSGTPTTTSTIFFSIVAANSDNNTATLNFSLTPKPALAVWVDNTLSTTTIKVGQEYNDGVVANGATTYAVHNGSLPPGLSLDTSSGVLSGQPTTVGTYTFVLRAANSLDERIFTSTLSITVEPAGSGKVWNGAAWVLAPFTVWNGAAWVEAPAKVWNGSTWVDPVS